MKNCGLIALSDITEIKNITLKTLVLLAKDNGLNLNVFNVPINEITNDILPAILESEGHLSYIKNVAELDGLKLTGNVISTRSKIGSYKKIKQKNLTNSLLGSWVAVGVGAATAIAGGIKASKAAKDKKAAAEEAKRMEEVPLTNIAEELKVSTIGAKNRQEGQSALEAAQTAALSEAGTRGIVGGFGKVTAGSQNLNRDIAADLDQQQKNIDMLRAEDAGRIRLTKEERKKAKLAALSSQYNAANDSQQQAYGNIIQGAGMAGGALANRPASNSGTSAAPKFSGTGTEVPSSIGWKPKY